MSHFCAERFPVILHHCLYKLTTDCLGRKNYVRYQYRGPRIIRRRPEVRIRWGRIATLSESSMQLEVAFPTIRVDIELDLKESVRDAFPSFTITSPVSRAERRRKPRNQSNFLSVSSDLACQSSVH